MHRQTLLPLFSLSATLPTVSAWGALGHQTVAFIASNLVSNTTASFAQSLLNDTTPDFLANIATWADSYRYTAEGAFSSVLHYIDALDSPPESCDVIYERDCPEEGCIVSAIANYTQRVTAGNVSISERQNALKWIVHFLGDIHQPLHVENLEIGGNTINVTFDGTVTNLHHIWDSNIPEKLRGGYALEDSREWAEELTEEIVKGKYKKASKKWAKGIDVSKPIDSAMVWARDANAFVCDTVVPDGADAVRNEELGGEYYESTVGVITMQIAKAGFRLAKWLDAIVAAKMGKKDWDYGRFKRNGMVKREANQEAQLEPWMVEARRARRAFGGCQHEH